MGLGFEATVGDHGRGKSQCQGLFLSVPGVARGHHLHLVYLVKLQDCDCTGAIWPGHHGPSRFSGWAVCSPFTVCRASWKVAGSQLPLGSMCHRFSSQMVGPAASDSSVTWMLVSAAGSWTSLKRNLCRWGQDSWVLPADLMHAAVGETVSVWALFSIRLFVLLGGSN